MWIFDNKAITGREFLADCLRDGKYNATYSTGSDDRLLFLDYSDVMAKPSVYQRAMELNEFRWKKY